MVDALWTAEFTSSMSRQSSLKVPFKVPFCNLHLTIWRCLKRGSSCWLTIRRVWRAHIDFDSVQSLFDFGQVNVFVLWFSYDRICFWQRSFAPINFCYLLQYLCDHLDFGGSKTGSADQPGPHFLKEMGRWLRCQKNPAACGVKQTITNHN